MSNQAIVKINIVSLSQEVLKKIEDCYNFCYPENSFKPERAKAQIAQIGEYASIMIKIIALNKEPTAITELINHFFSLVSHYKKIAFPHGEYDAKQAHIVLSSHGLLRNIYQAFDKTVIKATLDKKVFDSVFNVDLKELFNTISIAESYSVAYPNDRYAKEFCHQSMQMLQADNFMLSALSYHPIVFYEYDILKQPLKDLLKNTNQLVSLIGKAYPNHTLDYENGHTYLTDYIKHYKHTKTTLYQHLDTISNFYSLENKTISEKEISTEQEAFEAINNLVRQNDKKSLRKNIL